MKNKVWQDDIDAALHDTARRYTGERYDFATHQHLDTSRRRFSAGAWKDMAEMGWLALATPESCGGLGVRISSIALLAEEAGRALVNEPLLGTGMLAPFLIAHHGDATQRDALLPRLHAGELRMACVLGDSRIDAKDGCLTGLQEVVPDADIADQLIVEVAGALWLVDATTPGVDRHAYPLLDGRGAATLRFDAAPAIRLGNEDNADFSAARRIAALATAADSLGAMQAAFDLTLDYLKTRRQFGVPLGTHQVLQHRAVDMYLRLGESRAVVEQAVASMQSGTPEAARDAHAAKSFVCESARLALQEAVQLHGGIGITEEYAVSHYLRRVRVNEQLHGSAEAHLLAFAATPAPFH